MCKQTIEELQQSFESMNNTLGKRLIHNHMSEEEKTIFRSLVRDMKLIRKEINKLIDLDLNKN